MKLKHNFWKTRIAAATLAFALLIAAALSTACLAAVTNNESISPTDFFIDGSSARVFGMGNAFVGLADDVSAVYWNPAGLSFLLNNEFSSTRSSRSVFDLDTTTQNLSLAIPMRRGTVGFNLVYSTLGNAIETSQDEQTGRLTPIGVIDSDETAFSFSYSVPWRGRKDVSLGATVKNARQKISGESFSGSHSGWGFDFGIMKKFRERARVGLVFQNLGDMDVGTDVVPFNVRLGASGRLLEDKLTLSAQFDTDYLDDSIFSVGGEYTLAENFAARLGSYDGEVSFGVGVEYTNFHLDYAFNNDNDLGGLSKISISYLTPSSRKKAPAKTKPRAPEKPKKKDKLKRGPRPDASSTDEVDKKEKKKTTRKKKTDKKAKKKKEKSKTGKSKKGKIKKDKASKKQEKDVELKKIKTRGTIAGPSVSEKKTPEPTAPVKKDAPVERFEEEQPPEYEMLPSIDSLVPAEPESSQPKFEKNAEPMIFHDDDIETYEKISEPEEGEGLFGLDTD